MCSITIIPFQDSSETQKKVIEGNFGFIVQVDDQPIQIIHGSNILDFYKLMVRTGNYLATVVKAEDCVDIKNISI